MATMVHDLSDLSLGAVLNWWQLAAALITLVPPFVIGILVTNLVVTISISIVVVVVIIIFIIIIIILP